jgi:hypothetical protein
MSMQVLLADLRNTRTLLEAEQERRQRAEAKVEAMQTQVDHLTDLLHSGTLVNAGLLAQLITVTDERNALRAERRSLWRFVKPEEGVPVVFVGVHVVHWYEAAGEYEPTAGFVQADSGEDQP